MKINVVTLIPFPIESVFTAMRDHLPDLAQYMPNVKSIVVEERNEDADGNVSFVNRWNAASTEIPAVARPFIDSSEVFWLDHAEWLNDGATCNWRLEMGFMAERINCTGQTLYESAGPMRTEMQIKGNLELDLKGLVPRLLMGRATAGIEKFVGKLIEPNFKKTSDALTAYLESQSS
tara:strand:+ start:92 stop:622 length:531 start_codon:yes stop_codon:yes gene_type:complete